MVLARGVEEILLASACFLFLCLHVEWQGSTLGHVHSTSVGVRLYSLCLTLQVGAYMWLGDTHGCGYIISNSEV